MKKENNKKIISKKIVEDMCVHEIEKICFIMSDIEKKHQEELLNAVANTVLSLNELIDCMSNFSVSYSNFISERDYWYYCMKITQIRNQFIQECEYRYSIEIGDYNENEVKVIDDFIIDKFELKEIFESKYLILPKGKFYRKVES